MNHYTPGELSTQIVRSTLRPFLSDRKVSGCSQTLLDLKICDPAMGSGSLLLEVCYQLARLLLKAWQAEGFSSYGGQDPLIYALRRVAQGCIYGVDRDPFAVELAKVSIWLVTYSSSEPVTFVDHSLRCGDALVGLNSEQLKKFHWDTMKHKNPTWRCKLLQERMKERVLSSLKLRREILQNPEMDMNSKKRLFYESESEISFVKLLGDLIVGAFFSSCKTRGRKKELARRWALVEPWLESEDFPPQELLELQGELKRSVTSFHWVLEFPEIFYVDTESPLAGERARGGMDAFVGNPPFIGGGQLSGLFGTSYLDWILSLHTGSHGNSDFAAHFFLRASSLSGERGVIGMVATNTISQGDTRETGLKKMLKEGYKIYEATQNVPWPGEASVTVSVIHLSRNFSGGELNLLNGVAVTHINSRLRPEKEREDPERLPDNGGLSFLGVKTYGTGFELTSEERQQLVERDPRNAERIFPYLGGKEVNTSPVQDFQRYIINFGQMEQEEAETWPDLMEIVRNKVKPKREKNKRETRKKYWWRFAETSPALFASISSLERCLVTARTSKYSIFSFQPTNRIFSENLVVFPLESWSAFALLQSRIHGIWVSFTSSTLETRIGYRPSDCFETFPFPKKETLRAGLPVDLMGQVLYEARAKYMIETNRGLTTTYDLLKSSDSFEVHIVELRKLHEEVDRVVLESYGWTDLKVPPYNSVDKKFENRVIDRLFSLNLSYTSKRESPEAYLGNESKPN